MIDTITGFHIEPTNICTLKCAGCSRTRFINQWPGHWKNHNLDIDSLLSFLDIDLTGKQMNLCGNYGDPIYHNDFINFVAKLKQSGARITITTNGSYQSRNWWQELTGYLGSQDKIRFSIDGTPDNFTQYRKNADWISIQTAIETCVASDCQTVWKYIPFSYNQHSIEQAKKLSKELGVDNFLLEPSDRFDQQTLHLLPSSGNLIGEKFVSMAKWKKEKFISNVNPKCNSGREHFITADGHYSPCCYIADHRFYYKNQFGKNKKSYDITKTTVSQLLADASVIEFYQNLDQQPACQYNCPKT